MKSMTFPEIVKHLRKGNRPMSLLLGNGFSMSYDSKIFSYNALYNFLTSQNDELLNRLFEVIKTRNFELIMQQLDTTSALLDVFDSDEKLQEKVKTASENLKQGLLESVKSLHPEHVFKIPDSKSVACGNFIRLFLESAGQIFTTNYDLLLYWVLMRQSIGNPIDGFGRELLNPFQIEEGEEPEFSDQLLWGPHQAEQNVHYLHGALHLFDTGIEIEKEQYDSEGLLLENISARMNRGAYPIFVTAGNGDEKLAHIRHNRYLTHCYDSLSKLDGSLVTFGFSFGQYDEHIIEAINRAANVRSKSPPKLWSVYIGTYSQSDRDHIESIEAKFLPKVRVFDASTANIWGG